MSMCLRDKVRYFISRLALLILFSLTLVNTTFGQSSSWLNQENPVIVGGSIIDNQLMTDSLSDWGNVECSNYQFVIKPKRILPSYQKEETATKCAVFTKYGVVAGDGLIRLNGTKIAGRLKSFYGSSSTIFPIPDSETAIVLSSTAKGAVVKFYENFYRSIDVKVKLDGSADFVLPAQPTYVLKDNSGKIKYVRTGTISFSDNGKWMLADAEHIAALRVDLSNYEIVPFATPQAYHLGYDPALQSSISDDGSLALTASSSGEVRVTDVSSCESVPTSIDQPVSCESKSLKSFFSGQTSDYDRVLRPRFINKKLVSLYIRETTTSSTKKISRYRLAPFGQTIEKSHYLALGDSYVSGEGAYDYFSETDTPENMCHLSKASYPYLIGQDLELKDYDSVACSGAKIENFADFVQKSKIPNPNTMGNLLPGYKKQLNYVQEHNPDVVTIGIGGNDIGFGDILIRCIGTLGIVPGNCYDTYEDRIELVRLANTQLGRLEKTYKTLRSQNTEARVYAISYPNIAQNDGNCAVNVRLNNEEIKFSNHLIEYFNLVIETAAKRAGVFYVDAEKAFAGHKLCETDSKNSAVNGVTFGDDGPAGFGPIANEGFHPNKLGHQLYRISIQNKTSNLSATMPLPDETAELPAEDSGLEILDSPSVDRPVRSLSLDSDMTSDTLFIGETVDLSIDGNKYSLKPGATYQVELHSDPVSLGIVSADEYGNLSENINVPQTIPLGFHTIHAIGENILGEAIDIYKTVFVGVSENDYDGDGVTNSIDSCPTDIDSGEDQDFDGIDDICDEKSTLTKTESKNTGDDGHDSYRIYVNKRQKTPGVVKDSSFDLAEDTDSNIRVNTSKQYKKQLDPTDTKILGKTHVNHSIFKNLYVLACIILLSFVLLMSIRRRQSAKR